MYGLALEHDIGFKGESAVDYFRVGAAIGYVQSLNNLATRIDDMEYTNRLWRRSAEMGLRHACYNLAVSYGVGRGIEKDDQQAAFWMKRAADQLYVPAMFDFAMMLRDGVGVDKDEAAAIELCTRASRKKIGEFVYLQKSQEQINRILQHCQHRSPSAMVKMAMKLSPENG
jgi:TPR repeat protein